ncbi:response regulator [Nitrosopumilus sp.]|uniref:TackOD1 domain-containing metal-binding protein n=1 Tax=Nitrosopumilus sp. TaxID=2024843 RepID=UPI00247D15A6|nr:response regulator [Nitrosopumilus sp.]MCV0431463.1 response regulator [Nitrosopumilus sp.]
MKRPVLLIDDSENILTRMKEFLEKLGQKEIHLEKCIENGIKKFQELSKEGIHPIAFIDYDIQDGSGISLLSRLLELDPDGEIIIMTALEKNSEIISKLINEGAYEILSKPIRLEALKNIFSIIELENSEEPKYADISELLKTTNRLSEAWLSDKLSVNNEELNKNIERWISDGKIKQIEDIKEVFCPSCNSIKTGHIFHCPQCKRSDFNQIDLIEHYSCGNIAEEREFRNDKCPSCNKELKALGIDYRRIKNHYVCNSCENKFSEIGCDFLCLNCNKQFTEEEAVWKSSRGFLGISKYA